MSTEHVKQCSCSDFCECKGILPSWSHQLAYYCVTVRDESSPSTSVANTLWLPFSRSFPPTYDHKGYRYSTMLLWLFCLRLRDCWHLCLVALQAVQGMLGQSSRRLVMKCFRCRLPLKLPTQAKILQSLQVEQLHLEVCVGGPAIISNISETVSGSMIKQGVRNSASEGS